MKLRLEVLRHGLPATKVLWQADNNITVAELLKSLNAIIPLEAESWGLEDYVVETDDGFEVLHFQCLGDVLRKNERYRIRALDINDRRVRRITGRSQIDASGRHLLDGVAFGRPLLRAPNRPEIYIPPLRLTDTPEETNHTQLALADRIEWDHQDSQDDEEDDDYIVDSDEAEWDEDEDESEDGAFGMDEAIERDEDVNNEGGASTKRTSRTRSQASILSNTAGDPPSTTMKQAQQGVVRSHATPITTAKRGTKRSLAADSGAPSKRVRWSDQVPDPDLSSSESGSSYQSSSQASDDQDDSASSSAVSSDDEEDDQRATVVKPLNTGSTVKPIHTTTAVKSTSTTTAAKPTDATTAVKPVQPTVPPGCGKQSTKLRNIRRKAAKHLAALKQQGLMAQDATTEDLRKYEQSRASSPGAGHSPSPVVLNASAVSKTGGDMETALCSLPVEHEGVKTSDESTSSGDKIGIADSDSDTSGPLQLSSKQVDSGTIAPTPDALTNEAAEFEARRESLLRQIKQGGVDLTNFDPSTGLEIEHRAEDLAEKAPVPSAKRRKLDVNASNRLLFGSLGHKSPRNAEERATLVDKLRAPKNNAAATKSSTTKTDPNGAATEESVTSKDPDYWKEHIDLSAIECCGADVEQKIPPFPFYRRWTSGKQKQGNKRKRNGDHEAYYDHGYGYAGQEVELDENSYFSHGRGDWLDYGDPVDEAINDMQAAADNKQAGWDEAAEEEPVDDLPSVPEDVSTLPALTMATIQLADVIIYQVLEVSAANKWTPSLSPIRTATVLNDVVKTGRLLRLQLAQRDMPDHTYDEDGNRIWEKLEMPDDMEDDETGIVGLMFEELVAPKLLLRKPLVDALRMEERDAAGASSAAGGDAGSGEKLLAAEDNEELVAATEVAA